MLFLFFSFSESNKYIWPILPIFNFMRRECHWDSILKLFWLVLQCMCVCLLCLCVRSTTAKSTESLKIDRHLVVFFSEFVVSISLSVNPFHTTGLFLYSLKISENLFSDVFRGYRKAGDMKWVNENFRLFK